MHGHTHSYITVVYTLSIFCHTLINERVQYFAQGGAECAQHNVQSPNQVSHETSALWWESSQSYWLTRLRTLPALLWRFPRAPSDSIRNIIQLKAKCHISAYLPTAAVRLSVLLCCVPPTLMFLFMFAVFLCITVLKGFCGRINRHKRSCSIQAVNVTRVAFAAHLLSKWWSCFHPSSVVSRVFILFHCVDFCNY